MEAARRAKVSQSNKGQNEQCHRRW